MGATMGNMAKTIGEQKVTLAAILLSAILTGSGVKVFGNVDQQEYKKMQEDVVNLRIAVAVMQVDIKTLLERIPAKGGR